ncbi:Inversin-A [Chionoecetes opilio]|uniref:Inversin-A n=1 Tax=Chionoecetes opilio TaxID=41210 RepID=A0A8J8WD14_CHIOP|nr:Inversin-A [Chionoecetes opilio]
MLTVVESQLHRQYMVSLDSLGRVTIRNRRFLRPIPATNLPRYATHDKTPVRVGVGGNTAIHAAAQKGHVQCVFSLIECTPTTTANYEGATPVHSASFGGHVEVIEMLESNNWPTKIQDVHGRTALHWAAWNGKVEAVAHLVNKSNLDPLKKCKSGFTPLEYAVMFGKHETERWLMKDNVQDLRDNEQVLHLMIRHGGRGKGNLRH